MFTATKAVRLNERAVVERAHVRNWGENPAASPLLRRQCSTSYLVLVHNIIIIIILGLRHVMMLMGRVTIIDRYITPIGSCYVIFEVPRARLLAQSVADLFSPSSRLCIMDVF
jgi:hypothetical protein